ncbi:MAG: hypothetical protein AB7H93_11135 [Vicinamibacterales bacterium]
MVAALVAAAALWAARPPATAPPVGPRPLDHAPFAFHVHTTRSDGTGSRDTVAAAAARAGLAAVILADHGDGRRRSDPPAYLDGVLVIDAVEISTWSGHYVAIGAAAAPYPLGGEPRAVVEDVARLGGFGVASHPGSAKEDLRWRDWDAAIDGVEWLNGDSEWRDRPRRVWRTALAYPFRAVEAVTALVDRPAFELTQWDRAAARRPVVGLAAHDAHARLGLRGVGEPYEEGLSLAVPSYRVLFESFSNVAMLPSRLSGRADEDAAALLAALRAGRVYAVLSGIAPSGEVRFEGQSGGGRAAMGAHLRPDGPVRLQFQADVPAGATSVLVCDGREVARAAGGALDWQQATDPGACRVEVRVEWDGGERPWLVTNPIYARAVLAAAPPLLPDARTLTPLAAAAPAAWTIETATDATAVVARSAGAVDAIDFSWQLGPSAPTFAAIQTATPPELAGATAVTFRAAADRPRRLWVQVRVPDGTGQRWGASFYVDRVPREIRVPLTALAPFGDAHVAPVPLDRVTALLVVTDTVHAEAGSRGSLTLGPVQLAR